MGLGIAGFTLEVLGGRNFTLSNDTVKDGPIIFHVYDPEDAYSRWMWKSDDSVQVSSEISGYAVCVCLCACARACVRESARVCLCACMRA